MSAPKRETNGGPAPSGADGDLRLVGRAQAGDTDAFEQLVRRHECRVYRTTLALTGNPEDAEEALQDAFLNAYVHLKEFRGDSRFTTWLTRVAINAALHKLRHRRDTLSLDDPDIGESLLAPKHFESWHANPEQLYAKEEIRGIVQGAIASVPPAYRVVLVLRDVAGMDTVEAAEVLGLTIAAVKSRLLRARLMVRETLAARSQKRPGWRSKLVETGWMIRGMMFPGSVKLRGTKRGG
jgi:RNA polymerase sigma-70 factor (ECF subfamily)